MRAKWNQSTIIEAFKLFYSVNGRAPMTRDARGGNIPNQSNVRKSFPTWNDALRAAGIPLVKDFDEPTIKAPCCHCGKEVERLKCKVRKRIFCNYSCMAHWNNSHKTKAYKRSKLEFYIETRLRFEYPSIDFVFNDRSAIGSELDVYVPALKLAFELNGIFHYEPIYGKHQLSKIQNNDNRKFQACLERGIELCIIDTSGQRRATQMEKYYHIVESVLTQKLTNTKIV